MSARLNPLKAAPDTYKALLALFNEPETAASDADYRQKRLR